MNQNTFSVIFIIVCALISLGLSEFGNENIFSRYIIIFMIIAYFAGRYSVKLPKQ